MIQERKNNLIGMLLIVLSAFLVSSGQFIWKISKGQDSFIILILLGFVLYGFGAISMLIALNKGKLSTLYPLMATGYIFAFFYSVIILKESFQIIQVIGIGLILIGSVLLGRSD